ncbi:hypothetical protein [Dyadobacter sp. Leaf189]|uniref:hypothetical protein n=1 Tax=Dyadobacter sp. Leaf189 TaxID=1736295 RepID=UPI0006F39924|nr:hypothetical protein [Dyadobacter sp. Leaf189]KQS27049.1 hypothetical protein ASG33_21185 [Dyadobacter sp. Leaf189]
MKVLFICSSVEPGRDGVGDYTRRLAAELIRQGHSALVIGLHDKHLIPASLKEPQLDGEREVEVLRFSSSLAWEKRLAAAAHFVASVDPDWISLQYVSYGFDSQGLPWRLPWRIRRLSEQRRLHVMFHELWLDKPVNLKERLLAKLQKSAILQSIRQMQPEVINVTIPFNRRRLKGLNYTAAPLGLFGNVPVLLADQNGDRSSACEEKHILYFGTPPKTTFLKKLVDDLAEFCAANRVPVRITIVSGSSEQTNRFIEQLTTQLAGFELTISDLGFASLEKLSTLMHTCDVGISRSEPHLLGKSGTAIAMLEHGLPVWLPKWSGTKDIRFDFRKELLFSDLRKALNAQIRCPPDSLLPKTAQNFIDQLTQGR